jgi:NADP-dependent 3-hydroxy acid dehydrogenase YdfG
MDQEKLVIVTGASRGIGFFITQELLKKGFKVHMIADQEKRLKEAQIKLKQYGNVVYSVLNLSAREQIKDFCDQWKQAIFGLVNNAGCWTEERIDEPDKNTWDPIMKLYV